MPEAAGGAYPWGHLHRHCCHSFFLFLPSNNNTLLVFSLLSQHNDPQSFVVGLYHSKSSRPCTFKIKSRRSGKCTRGGHLPPPTSSFPSAVDFATPALLTWHLLSGPTGHTYDVIFSHCLRYLVSRALFAKGLN